MIFPDLPAPDPDFHNSKKPFPYSAFCNYWPEHLLKAALLEAERLSSKWWEYDNVFEKKSAFNDFRKMGPYLQDLISTMNSGPFISWLSKHTGIEGLICDPHLNGGGIHKVDRGGKLNIHCDHNFHPVTKLDRRLNVILYLNYEWKTEWGGELELWEPDMRRQAIKIVPRFNTMVVFNTTDDSPHGHPDPLDCPPGVSRLSLALYYYTNGRPVAEVKQPHSTLYKARPTDIRTEEIEILRRKRARGRL